MGSQRTITCACCGQPGRLGGRGLIVRCESRLRKYHRDDLADFPRQQRARADMLDDYATWRARRPVATQQEIAEEMGVTRSALRRALDRDRAQARAETTAPSEGQKEMTMGVWSRVMDWLKESPASAYPEDEYNRRNRWDAATPDEDAYIEQTGAKTWADVAEVRDAQRDAHLLEAEQADLELSEDIAAGVVPVEYTDDGVRIGENFHSHDSISDEPATVETRCDEPARGVAGFIERLRDEVAERQLDRADEADDADLAAGHVVPFNNNYDADHGYFKDDEAAAGVDQWRAPGTAGHDEEQARWQAAADEEDRAASWIREDDEAFGADTSAFGWGR